MFFAGSKKANKLRAEKTDFCLRGSRRRKRRNKDAESKRRSRESDRSKSVKLRLRKEYSGRNIEVTTIITQCR